MYLPLLNGWNFLFTCLFELVNIYKKYLSVDRKLITFSFCPLVQFETEGHQAVFSIKIRHAVTPKLYNTGSKEGTVQLYFYNCLQAVIL